MVGSIDTISRAQPRRRRGPHTRAGDGRHWQVVVLAGPGAGRSMGRTCGCVTGFCAPTCSQTGRGSHRRRRAKASTLRGPRRAVLDDEYRLLVAAVTRLGAMCISGGCALGGCRALRVLSFDLVARPSGGHTPRERRGAARCRGSALSLPGHIAGGARAASSDDTVDAQLRGDAPGLMAREGTTSAQPGCWLGAGGTLTPTSQGDPSLSGLACLWFLLLSALTGRRECGGQAWGTLVHALAEENPHGTPIRLRRSRRVSRSWATS